MLLPCILLLLGGCTSYITPHGIAETPPSTDGATKLVTIPLPIIAASPNEGMTTGALTAFLLHNSKDEVTTLLAPQLNHTDAFGTTASFYGAYYPTAEHSLEINLSRSEKINEDYELKLRESSFLNNKLELNLHLFGFTDGSARFFGFEARTIRQQETNYGDRERGSNISLGYDIGHHLQLTVGERFRTVSIGAGAISGVPSIRSRFDESSVPGIDGFTTQAVRASLSYSTLDNRDTPTYGGYTRITFEPTLRAVGGAGDYRHYEIETKGYIPLDHARYISVFRLMYNQTRGENVPFLEQSILGGENSLRGYGRNRFIDNSFLLCNIEERIRLFRWEVFGVTADWELAPFLDMGAVMESLAKGNSSNFELNPGLGFRAVVRPNIVGRLDVGVGKEGPAVFVGLGYPF